MKKFTVYSKPNCTYCDQAKALLEQKGLEFEIIMLDVGQPKDAGVSYILREQVLQLFPTARTMPQVTVTGADGVTHIGGFSELRQYLSQ